MHCSVPCATHYQCLGKSECHSLLCSLALSILPQGWEPLLSCTPTTRQVTSQRARSEGSPQLEGSQLSVKGTEWSSEKVKHERQAASPIPFLGAAHLTAESRTHWARWLCALWVLFCRGGSSVVWISVGEGLHFLTCDRGPLSQHPRLTIQNSCHPMASCHTKQGCSV